MSWVLFGGNCAPWCSQLNLLCTKKSVNFESRWITLNSIEVLNLAAPTPPCSAPQNAAMKAPNWCALIERIENDRLPRTTWAGLFSKFSDFSHQGMECYCATIKMSFLFSHIHILFLTYFSTYLSWESCSSCNLQMYSKQTIFVRILCIECPGNLMVLSSEAVSKMESSQEKHTLRTAPLWTWHGKETKFLCSFHFENQEFRSAFITRDSPCALLFQIRTSAKH